jgi:hypothetical protein
LVRKREGVGTAYIALRILNVVRLNYASDRRFPIAARRLKTSISLTICGQTERKSSGYHANLL